MAIVRNRPDNSRFNPNAALPYELRLQDFELAMQDVYDFFYDVNLLLAGKGLNASTTCCDRRSCLVCFRTC